MASERSIGVGLVGAGPWSERFLAPMLARGPETRLLGIWGRRPGAVNELAQRFDARAFPSFEDLVDSCEAVAFCVPPAVQAELALVATAAGRALLFSKPLAEDVNSAEQVARAAEDAGVPTLFGLNWHVHPATLQFVAASQQIGVSGCEASFLSSAYLAGPFATDWRLRRGVILDIGPHAFDLLELCAGSITAVHVEGHPLRFVSILAEHTSGAVSAVLLSASAGIDPYEAKVRAYGEIGSASLDCAELDATTSMSCLCRLFAALVKGKTSAAGLGVARGLEIQRIIGAAERSLASGGAREAVSPCTQGDR